MLFKTPKEKSLKHEKEGDRHRDKGSHRKAIASYRKALDFDEMNIVLLEKLTAALDACKEAWTEADFADSMTWTMRRQELVDPVFKRINARGTPEYKEAATFIKTMLTAKTRDDETAAVESLVALGADALYPLVDYLLTFKDVGRNPVKPKISHAGQKKHD